jgi:hypothetical protein
VDNDFFINTVPIKTHDAPLFSKREVFFFREQRTYIHTCIRTYTPGGGGARVRAEREREKRARATEREGEEGGDADRGVSE